MEYEKLRELRREAEAAVADMKDAALKTKAFEVILEHLLGSSEGSSPESISKSTNRAMKGTIATSESSVTGRILLLKDEGFFTSQRTIGEIRQELAAHGWHYEPSNLSGKLQALVGSRKLRRMKANEGNRKIWKYSEP